MGQTNEETAFLPFCNAKKCKKKNKIYKNTKSLQETKI